MFWVGTIILLVVSLVAMYATLALVGVTETAVWISMLVAFALAFPYYALMAKRFQDRDKPGLLALLGIVPLYAVNLLQTFGIIDPVKPTPLYWASQLLVAGLGLWILVELGCLKGTAGPNRFGADPLGQAKPDAAL
jgi:uncharacterized membrane protein YhaH (DUF805 family)